MVKVYIDQDTAPVRYPRTQFAHAHASGQTPFPAAIFANIWGEIFWKIPDNWNGFDKIYLWFRGTATGAGQCDMDFNGATHNELFNVHTLSLLNQVVNVVLNEYERVDVTVAVTAWTALLTNGDLINIRIDDDNEIGIEFVGVEFQES